MVAMSHGYRRFLEIMETMIHKKRVQNWEMPLPFRSSNITMPYNRYLAVNRVNGLLRTFKKKPKMGKKYFQFMNKVFERGHAVPVPREELLEISDQERSAINRNDGRVWYLPYFGVYHPRKLDQMRVVFDSSVEFQGIPLSKELFPGTNIGVLIRFR